MTSTTIDTETLRRWLADGTPLWLLHGSGPDSFRRSHLPGAICPADLAQATAALGPGERIVVYGDDPACPTTLRWRTDLVSTGYRDVWWYAAGTAGWRRAGGAVEGTAAGTPDPCQPRREHP